MNKRTYLFILLIVLSWTINPFLKKKGVSKLSSEEFMFFNHFLCSILIIIYFMYLFYNRQCSVKCLKNLSKFDLMYSVVGALLTVISSIALIKLLKENEATFIMPQIQPIVIFLTLLIGLFIFKEDLNNFKILGCILIILGLLIINKNS